MSDVNYDKGNSRNDKRGHPAADKRHTCPFKVEIGGDSRTTCWCCEDCEQECREDV